MTDLPMLGEIGVSSRSVELGSSTTSPFSCSNGSASRITSSGSEWRWNDLSKQLCSRFARCRCLLAGLLGYAATVLHHILQHFQRRSLVAARNRQLRQRTMRAAAQCLAVELQSCPELLGDSLLVDGVDRRPLQGSDRVPEAPLC